jgi:hypothetical protein
MALLAFFSLAQSIFWRTEKVDLFGSSEWNAMITTLSPEDRRGVLCSVTEA